jgi:hypothetical protein
MTLPRTNRPAGALLLCCLSVVNVSYGQSRVRVGVQVGGSRSTGSYTKAPGIGFSFHPLAGFETGLRLQVQWAHWTLQPALLYSQQGFVLTEDSYSVDTMGTRRQTRRLTYRLTYLTLPLSLAYQQHPNGQGLQVFAGGYVSRLVGGHLDYEGTLSSPGYTYQQAGRRAVRAGQVFRPDGNEYFWPWDAGLQAGLGYAYGGFLGQAGYRLGLVNTWVPRASTVSSTNRALFVSVSYFLSRAAVLPKDRP